jgi:hypothetical protein
MWSPETIKLECLVRTDGARLSYLVKFERIEIVLDVYRVLLKHRFPEEGVGHRR